MKNIFLYLQIDTQSVNALYKKGIVFILKLGEAL